MSLRRRLALSLLTILALFALNVGTHFWGSYARSQSMVAYRQSVTASQLTSRLGQMLDREHQQILVLATLRETTDDPLAAEEQANALDSIAALRSQLDAIGALSRDVTSLQYERLELATQALVSRWETFYRRYNDPDYRPRVEDPAPYLTASASLDELEQRQAFIAVQRARIIDRTIALTDRITVIGFVASIVLTALLGFLLVRYTNRSLQRLRRGTERIGSGDLSYRIEDLEGRGELGELAAAFNTMAAKLRRAIVEVSSARDAADRANAAKSLFLANVSHELRTPLNAIIGYSEMLQDELGDGTEIDRAQFHEDLDRIVRSGRQLLGLINDILDLSRIESGRMQLHDDWFEPAEIIDDVARSLAPLVREKSNRLELQGLEGLPPMHSDRTRFRQIVVNLVSNACKFTEQGLITVRAEPLETEPRSLRMQVVDTGIGMSETAQARIFEAFVQAESDTEAGYGGSGLGLAICRDICTMLGGSISVQSVPGRGSTFSVVLPVHRASTPEAA